MNPIEQIEQISKALGEEGLSIEKFSEINKGKKFFNARYYLDFNPTTTTDSLENPWKVRKLTFWSRVWRRICPKSYRNTHLMEIWKRIGGYETKKVNKVEVANKLIQLWKDHKPAIQQNDLLTEKDKKLGEKKKKITDLRTEVQTTKSENKELSEEVARLQDELTNGRKEQERLIGCEKVALEKISVLTNNFNIVSAENLELKFMIESKDVKIEKLNLGLTKFKTEHSLATKANLKLQEKIQKEKAKKEEEKKEEDEKAKLEAERVEKEEAEKAKGLEDLEKLFVVSASTTQAPPPASKTVITPSQLLQGIGNLKKAETVEMPNEAQKSSDVTAKRASLRHVEPNPVQPAVPVAVESPFVNHFNTQLLNSAESNSSTRPSMQNSMIASGEWESSKITPQEELEIAKANLEQKAKEEEERKKYNLWVSKSQRLNEEAITQPQMSTTEPEDNTKTNNLISEPATQVKPLFSDLQEGLNSRRNAIADSDFLDLKELENAKENLPPKKLEKGIIGNIAEQLAGIFSSKTPIKKETGSAEGSSSDDEKISA